MKYESQYSLINVDEHYFPPRCVLHIPYCSIDVYWGKLQSFYIKKHTNFTIMNNLISYLIELGKCGDNKIKCTSIEKQILWNNTHKLEVIVKKNIYF